jgi:hypothetical protein
MLLDDQAKQRPAGDELLTRLVADRVYERPVVIKDENAVSSVFGDLHKAGSRLQWYRSLH